MEDLEKRIDQLDERNKKLEKSYSTLRGFCLFLLILVLWSFFDDIRESIWPREIEVPKIVIEDPDSDASAELDARGLVFWDKNEVARISLSNSESGPRLGLLDEKGKWRLSLDHRGDGPAFAMFDENEKWRVHLYQKSDCCRFFFCDAEGQPGYTFTFDSNGPQLNMWKKGLLVFEAPDEQ